MDNQVVSNFVNDKWIDRLYQTLQGKVYLIQKDSTKYKGAIKTKKFSGKTFSFTVRMVDGLTMLVCLVKNHLKLTPKLRSAI